MERIDIQGRRLLVLGFGCLGPAVLALIVQHVNVDASRITILSADDRHRDIARARGVRFVHLRVTREAYGDQLEPFLRAGDVLLNLSLGISTADLVAYCRLRRVLYLDTSIEDWAETGSVAATTYRLRQSLLRDARCTGPTALVCHGANPGLISHFAKRAILRLARARGVVTDDRPPVDWAGLAARVGIAAINLGERDTQAAHGRPRASNTWSIAGFHMEMSERALFAPDACSPDACNEHPGRMRTGNGRSFVELATPAGATCIESWTPGGGRFEGFLTAHPEVMALAELFSRIGPDGECEYGPAVKFIYQPCPAARAALLRRDGMSGDVLDDQPLIDEIEVGTDEIGVLLILQSGAAYWYGSTVDMRDARAVGPRINATTLQTASGVLAGLAWLVANPCAGLVEPEDVDSEFVLRLASAYLGDLRGGWVPRVEHTVASQPPRLRGLRAISRSVASFRKEGLRQPMQPAGLRT